MTIIAENRMNQEYHLAGLVTDKSSAVIPCPVPVVLTLGSESWPGEGKRGKHQARIWSVKPDALVKKKLA